MDSYSLILGRGLRYCISDKILDDADTANPWSTSSTLPTAEDRVSQQEVESINEVKIKAQKITE